MDNGQGTAKGRRNRKNKKGGQPNYENTPGENQQQQQQQQQQQRRKKKNGGRRGRGEDRYYGRFHCRICNRMWESALVFTFAGTKSVKYKQGCKNCDSDDAWYFPFALELIRCSVCLYQPCECRCEVCDGLTRPRFWTNPETDERDEDPRFEYCFCDDEDRRWRLGDLNDETKPHLSAFCGRCKSGRFCQRQQGLVIVDFDGDGNDD